MNLVLTPSDNGAAAISRCEVSASLRFVAALLCSDRLIEVLLISPPLVGGSPSARPWTSLKEKGELVGPLPFVVSDASLSFGRSERVLSAEDPPADNAVSRSRAADCFPIVVDVNGPTTSLCSCKTLGALET